MPDSPKNLAADFARCATRCSSSVGLDGLRGAAILVLRPNDIEFSGERKRVRCNEGLGFGRLLVFRGEGNVSEGDVECL